MHRKNIAHIDLSCLRENIGLLKQVSHSKNACLMVKANAYGHGIKEVAKAAESSVESFGIVSLEEAQQIRDAGVKKDLWLFSNLWSESISSLEDLNVTPVIGDFESLNHFLKLSDENKKFHLKINTGMNRFGFQMEQLEALVKSVSGFERRIDGLATHMLDGNAFREEDGHCSKQRTAFLKFIDALPLESVSKYHLYKSAPALLNEPELREKDPYFQWIRPGIAAYGSFPEKGFPETVDLKPLMQLESRVVCLQEVKKGESVSYSARWTAERDSLIGVVQLGYADGLPRSLSGKCSFLVCGEKLPQVGNICMDYLMMDLTKVREQVRVGDQVVIFGKQGDKINKVEDLAAAAGSIPYEILTSIAPRVYRQYQDNEERTVTGK